MIAYCKYHGIGLIPWAPLAGGLLARPLGSDETPRLRSTSHYGIRKQHEVDAEIINRVEEVAKRTGYTMAQVALAWVMAKSDAPIVGTTSIKNLDGLLDAVNVKLSEEDIKALEEPYQTRSIFGAL